MASISIIQQAVDNINNTYEQFVSSNQQPAEANAMKIIILLLRLLMLGIMWEIMLRKALLKVATSSLKKTEA